MWSSVIDLIDLSPSRKERRMRLIDADTLKKAVNGTTMSAEQRNLFNALIDRQPRTGYEETEVSKMLNEIDYWRKHCDLLESTIIKLAVRYMERDGL